MSTNIQIIWSGSQVVMAGNINNSTMVIKSRMMKGNTLLYSAPIGIGSSVAANTANKLIPNGGETAAISSSFTIMTA